MDRRSRRMRQDLINWEDALDILMRNLPTGFSPKDPVVEKKDSPRKKYFLTRLPHWRSSCSE